MRRLHEEVTPLDGAAGMRVHLDAAGNLIARYEGTDSSLPVQVIGSHVDSVPDAGKYDGVLGVVLGIAAVQTLGGRKLPFGIDVIAFSEEEGVRYRVPFLGSRSICGQFDRQLLEHRDQQGVSMADAFRAFGLDPARISEAAYPSGRIGGYLEIHIEQGPILESLNAPLGVVSSIAGQSRLWVTLTGRCRPRGHVAYARPEGRTRGGGGTGAPSRTGRARSAGASSHRGQSDRVAGSKQRRARVRAVCLDLRHSNDESRIAAVDEIRARAGGFGASQGNRVLHR